MMMMMMIILLLILLLIIIKIAREMGGEMEMKMRMQQIVDRYRYTEFRNQASIWVRPYVMSE